MVETKKGKLVNFRLRKHEDPVIIDWIEKQSNLSGAFRYFITKEVANYGIQDLSEKAPERVSEEQALNDFYNDILHALPKLKQEQKMMMLFKLQSELPTAFQSGLQMQPVAVSTPIPVDVPVSTPTPNVSNVSGEEAFAPSAAPFVQEHTYDESELGQNGMIASENHKQQTSEIDSFTKTEIKSEPIMQDIAVENVTTIQEKEDVVINKPKTNKPDTSINEGQKAKKKRTPSKKFDAKGLGQISK